MGEFDGLGESGREAPTGAAEAARLADDRPGGGGDRGGGALRLS
ncbi:hypothetical protein ACI2LC_31545 [Nonomuraea wenchangensis]